MDSSSGIVDSMLVSEIQVSAFELQLLYYVLIRKGMKTSSFGLNCSTAAIRKEHFSFE